MFRLSFPTWRKMTDRFRVLTSHYRMGFTALAAHRLSLHGQGPQTNHYYWDLRLEQEALLPRHLPNRALVVCATFGQAHSPQMK